MSETSRETLERMIEVAIELSPIPLTAGAVHRILETSIKGKISSRASIQRILDQWSSEGRVTVSLATIEKNGFIMEARHYRKAGRGEA